jgi:hypothetical protein
MISINGKPLIATHWDGYPSSLGNDLLKRGKSIPEILEVAKRHTIDAAERSIRKMRNDERVKEIANKFGVSESDARSGSIYTNIIGAGDYQIGHIENYGDFAEYQYDIRGDSVFFRPLNGEWPFSLEDAMDFKLLTPQEVIVDTTEG